MKKLFCILQIEQWDVVGMWHFQAENLEEIARRVTSEPRKYHYLLNRLGGETWWDESHPNFRLRTPEEFLNRLYNNYTLTHGSFEFQVFEVHPEDPEGYFARQLGKEGSYSFIPEVDELPWYERQEAAVEDASHSLTA